MISLKRLMSKCKTLFRNRQVEEELECEITSHLAESTPEFAQLAAMQAAHNPISVRRGNDTARGEPSEFVTGNYFGTLGVGAFAGRTLTDADDQPGASPAAMMSYHAWQSDFGSDLSVVGATFYLQSHPVTVVGIAPPGFFGDRISPNPPAFWIPLSAEPLLQQANSILQHPDECWLYVLGRVRPGVALGSLQEKISSHLRQWISLQVEYKRDKGAEILPRLHVILTPAGAGIQDLQEKTGKELYIDPNLTILDLRSLDQQLAGNFNQERLVARLTALFGLLTLVLASVGLYGISFPRVVRRPSTRCRRLGLTSRLRKNRYRVPQGLKSLREHPEKNRRSLHCAALRSG
jgi:hypothetical protein